MAFFITSVKPDSAPFTQDQLAKLKLKDILDLLVVLTGIGPFVNDADTCIVSVGHLKGVDPGALNTTNGSSGYFKDEVSANESAVKSLVLQALKDNKMILIQQLSLLYQIIIGTLRLSKLLPSAVLINIHHDMAIKSDHPLFDKRRFLIYYGSNRGLTHANKVKEHIMKQNPECVVVVLHHSKSPRRRLGFIARTFHTALIVEAGFVSQSVFFLKQNHTILNNAILDLYGKVQS